MKQKYLWLKEVNKKSECLVYIDMGNNIILDFYIGGIYYDKNRYSRQGRKNGR